VCCGAEFGFYHPYQTYCSKTCKARLLDRNRRNFRRRAQHYGVPYEVVSKDRVYERDGWRCGICKRKVDRDLRWPHEMSASLDHIVPMSCGGGHLYVNVQLAHLKCNVDKGARSMGEQLALLG